MSRYVSGTVLVLVSACTFGTMSVFARMAFATGVGVEQLMVVRFVVAAVAMLLLAGLRRDALPRGRLLVNLSLIGAGFYFAQSYTLYYALKRIPAGLASLLIYLYPAIVAACAGLLLRQKIRPASMVAVVLAFGGIVLTIKPERGTDGIGIACGLAAAVFYASYILVGSRAMKGQPPIPATAIVLSATATSYIVVCLILGVHLPTRLDQWLWAIVLGLSTVLAIATFLAGLDRVGPVDASTYSAIEPALTALLAFIILGERPTSMQIAGGLVVLLAVAFLAHSSSREAEAHG